MSVEKRETTINGRAYQMLTPSVLKSMPLCTKVAVMLGPVLATLGAQGDAAIEKFGSALVSVDPTKLDALFMDAVSASHLCVAGKPISDPNEFDRHFSEHKMDTYQVCLWCLWECVKDFFPQLGSFAQTMTEKAKEFASQTDGASTGG